MFDPLSGTCMKRKLNVLYNGLIKMYLIKLYLITLELHWTLK